MNTSLRRYGQEDLSIKIVILTIRKALQVITLHIYISTIFLHQSHADQYYRLRNNMRKHLSTQR